MLNCNLGLNTHDISVLHLIDSGGLFGAEKMLISLAVEQSKMGLIPVLGSIRKTGTIEKPIEREAERKGIRVITFDMRVGPNIPGILSILRSAKSNQFNILHSHGYKTNILLGFLPYTIKRMPMITTLHGWTNTTGWTKMRLNETMDAFSLHFVDKVVIVNKGMLANPKIRKLPENKLAIIDNGINVDDISEDSDYKLDPEITNKIKAFSSKGRVIASIGRVSAEKGYDHLIDAVCILRKEHGVDARLMIIGDGRLRNKLEHRAQQSGLSDNFMVTGYIDNAPRLLKYVDCYVISSLTEGLPITLLEVMASRTPIVATAVGGIPHVVDDKKEALLVPPQKPDEMAAAIFQVFHDEQLCKRMTFSAYRKVVESYSCKAMAARYKSIYQEVIAKSRHS